MIDNSGSEPLVTDAVAAGDLTSDPEATFLLTDDDAGQKLSSPAILIDVDAQDEPPPTATVSRVDRTDDGGVRIGYSVITQTENDEYIEDFDLNDQLTGTTYKTKDGYTQQRVLSNILDANGALVGTSWTTNTSAPPGYVDESIEVYDLDGRVVSSRYSNSDGLIRRSERLSLGGLAAQSVPIAYGFRTEEFINGEQVYTCLETYSAKDQLLSHQSTSAGGGSSTYTLEPLFADDNSLKGFLGTWIWSDSEGQQSSWQEFYDANFNPADQPMTKPLVDEVEDQPRTDEPLVGVTVLTEMTQRESSEDGTDSDSSDPLDMTGLEIQDHASSDPLVGACFEPWPLLWPVEPLPMDSDIVGFKEIEYQTDNLIKDLPLGFYDSQSVDCSPLEGSILLQLPETNEDAAATVARSGSSDLDLRKVGSRSICDAELTGDRNLNLRGNRRANTLTGNDGNNRINGGRGIDECIGGKGIDRFVLMARRNSHDWLTDFNPQDDLLELKGPRLEKLFINGSLRDDVLGKQLVWDSSSHILSFDPDGGSGGKLPITLAYIPTLNNPFLNPDLFVSG